MPNADADVAVSEQDRVPEPLTGMRSNTERRMAAPPACVVRRTAAGATSTPSACRPCRTSSATSRPGPHPTSSTAPSARARSVQSAKSTGPHQRSSAAASGSRRPSPSQTYHPGPGGVLVEGSAVAVRGRQAHAGTPRVDSAAAKREDGHCSATRPLARFRRAWRRTLVPVRTSGAAAGARLSLSDTNPLRSGTSPS